MGMAGECSAGHVVVQESAAVRRALADAGGRRGLVAVVDGGAEDWLGAHRPLVQESDAVSIVSVGEEVRSTMVDTGSTAPLPQVTGVPDSGALAELGRQTTDYVATVTDQGLEPVVVFDAVGAMVDAAGLESTFRLLHLLGARVRTAGGSMVTVIPSSLSRSDAETLAALAD